MRSGPELDAPFHFAVAGHAAQGHVVQLLAIQVVERSGLRKREWIPLASAAPFPKLVMILPLMSPPAPAVLLNLGNPVTDARVEDAWGLADSGADQTVLPE